MYSADIIAPMLLRQHAEQITIQHESLLLYPIHAQEVAKGRTKHYYSRFYHTGL